MIYESQREVFAALPLAERACTLATLPPPRHLRRVAGGLQHQLWQLEAGSEKFALKILSARAIRTPADRLRFERAEALAHRAAQNGVPALAALPLGQDGDEFVGEWKGAHFLLFLWRDGQVLSPLAVSPERAALMGGHLARVHALGIRFPEQVEPVPEAFAPGHFRELCRRASAANESWAPRLAQSVDELEGLNAQAMAAQRDLRRDWVMGHLDFDQKNVLWQDDEPLILDWEQAKPVHPALEAMGAGLSWAGQSAGAPSRETFTAWLAGYRAVGELALSDLERAGEGVLGKWLIWLELNVQRLLDPEVAPDERRIALDAGLHALGATLQLGRDGATYRAWCREAFGL